MAFFGVQIWGKLICSCLDTLCYGVTTLCLVHHSLLPGNHHHVLYQRKPQAAMLKHLAWAYSTIFKVSLPWNWKNCSIESPSTPSKTYHLQGWIVKTLYGPVGLRCLTDAFWDNLALKIPWKCTLVHCRRIFLQDFQHPSIQESRSEAEWSQLHLLEASAVWGRSKCFSFL